MNRSELHELMGRLEALEALAKLFNNLWFDRIREDIKDAKVQAYLTVFDDAFPHMNHVIEFVCRSAGLLSGGDVSQEQWQRMHGEFDYLHRLLKAQGEDLGGAAALVSAVAAPTEAPDPEIGADDTGADLSQEERQALESVEQSDIDSLFDEEEEDEAEEEEYEVEEDEEDIDALFAPGAEEDDDAAADLFDEGSETEEEDDLSIAGEMIEEDEDLDETEALEAAALLESVDDDDEGSDVAEGEEVATEEDELDDLLDGVDEEDMADEDVELEDLLEDAGEEDAVEGRKAISTWKACSKKTSPQRMRSRKRKSRSMRISSNPNRKQTLRRMMSTWPICSKRKKRKWQMLPTTSPPASRRMR